MAACRRSQTLPIEWQRLPGTGRRRSRTSEWDRFDVASMVRPQAKENVLIFRTPSQAQSSSTVLSGGTRSLCSIFYLSPMSLAPFKHVLPQPGTAQRSEEHTSELQ